MCAQVAQLSCGKGALQLGAPVRLLPCVDAPVAPERAAVYCSVATAGLITLVGLFASVLAPGVYYKGSSLCSCITAALIVAVEWFLACMGAVVCS